MLPVNVAKSAAGRVYRNTAQHIRIASCQSCRGMTKAPKLLIPSPTVGTDRSTVTQRSTAVMRSTVMLDEL